VLPALAVLTARAAVTVLATTVGGHVLRRETVLTVKVQLAAAAIDAAAAVA
jgi:hypothetical protein